MSDTIDRLYPLFDEIDGNFIFRPTWPAPPYPIYVSLDQLRDFVGGFPNYTIAVPTDGQTINVPAIDKYILNPASTIPTLTLRLPVALDKRNIRILTRERIDALTINALGGMSVDWAVAMLPQYGTIDFTFVEGLAAWVRI